MGLSRSVSEISGDFSRKSQNFSHFRVSPPKGFPLELDIGAWSQENKNDGASRPRKKSDDIFSRLDIVHQRDGQTDGQMDRPSDTGRQQRPRANA